ncbi:DUF551 domain-containing protein [Enterobacter roggenkampii]|uniref:DUF551 domain-containing protein n=1 Tax=Enterobacter roggenkampii TaxID=1812935 RepID=UPI0005791706|nr:DUF551 domain-containing protein [Enterobacter roggenkampii]
MSTITKEFTKEQLIEKLQRRVAVTANYPDVEEAQLDAAIFKIALASLEAEPVGEVSEQRDGLVMDGTVDLGGASTHRIIKGASKMKRLPLGTKFYTAPPAPVSVPDAMEMDDDFDSAFEHGKAVGWNAYRAAMLQSFGNSEQLNSPVIQDGWVACVERMPEQFKAILAFNAYGEVWSGAYDRYWNFYCDNLLVEHVTHWMPLPAAPQQEVK